MTANGKRKAKDTGWLAWVRQAVDWIEEEGSETPEDRTLIAYFREYGFDNEESRSWLGRYIPIRYGMPGNIILHRESLARFVRCARTDLAAKGYADDSEIQRALPYYLVWGTYAHEQFHFLCDVARYCAPSGIVDQIDTLGEEALATAWSRRCMLYLGRGTPGLEDLVAWKFDCISAPGYRDWRNYERHSSELGRAVRATIKLSVDDLEYLSFDLVPTPRTASWCNYWIGGESVLTDPARGRRGDSGFFYPELHASVLW